MRAKCSVYGCKSATYNMHGYMHMYHRFPKDLERRLIWMRFCKNSALRNKSHNNIWICSLHFEKSMYCNEFLVRSAVPTLNPPTKRDEKFDAFDFEYISYNDDATTSDSAAKSQANQLKDKDCGKKNIDLTSEVIETFAKIEEDDHESVTFSIKEEGLEEDADLNNDDDQSLDLEKEEYIVPTISKKPVVVGSKLSLGDIKVEPVYESTTQETLPNSGGQSTILSQILNKNTDMSAASVTDPDDDDCATFAAHIRARMRNFTPGQKAIAQKLISDVLFMADMQQLQMDSTVVHGQSQGKDRRPNTAPVAKRQRGTFSAYLDSEEDGPSTSKI